MKVGELIQLGEWMPDLPDYLNPGATTIKNAIPGKNSYLPLGSLESFTAAAGATVLSGVGVKDDAGNTADFAGSAANLYKLATDNTWSTVSISGGYSTGARDTWNWTQWGEQVLATNFADAIQEYTLGTSSLFAVLAAGAPRARYITVVKDFVMVGNTYDATDGNVPYRVRWCAIGDPTDWTVSATTQADYQDMESAYGAVQGVVGGTYGAVFQEKAVSRLTYVGSPSVFSIDRVERALGLFIPTSLATLGQTSFYIAEDGFYAFTYDRSEPIGAERVDKTFFRDLNPSFRYRLRSAIDPINKLVIWAYPSNDSLGDPDKLIIFNWAINRWSSAEVECEALFQFLSLGYTLEGLDTIGTNIDLFTISLDSRIWQGGDLALAAFNASHELASFTGTVLSAVLETNEFQLFDGYKSLISRVRPIVDNAVTIQVGVRSRDQDDVTWGAAASQNASGNCTVRSNGFRHRLRMNTNGDFTHAQGFELLEAAKRGRR